MSTSCPVCGTSNGILQKYTSSNNFFFTYFPVCGTSNEILQKYTSSYNFFSHIWSSYFKEPTDWWRHVKHDLRMPNLCLTTALVLQWLVLYRCWARVLWWGSQWCMQEWFSRITTTIIWNIKLDYQTQKTTHVFRLLMFSSHALDGHDTYKSSLAPKLHIKDEWWS